MFHYKELTDIVIGIMRNAAFITGFVLAMLLFVEYINALIAQKKQSIFGRSAAVQTVMAAMLGAIPGCVGGFAVVSLYVQGAAGIGALFAAFISSMGDEAMAMFFMFPCQALVLQATLLILAIPLGLIVNKCCKSINFIKNMRLNSQHTYHCTNHIHRNILHNLRHFTLRRALLIAGLALFIAALLSGAIEHSHTHGNHIHSTANKFFFGEYWINWLFAALSASVLIIVLFAERHFLDEHLWQHVIKRHFVKIFLWVLGTLLAVPLLEHCIEAQEWVSRSQWLMLAAALALGIIPASGPHLVFVVLFANGTIAFPVLFANMFVQDGHAGLPLLASSKRTFIFVKIIKIFLAGILGGIGLALLS